MNEESKEIIAEPVEDVVSRMLDAWYTDAESHPYDDLQRACMTDALAIAREGYVKLEDVEKAIEPITIGEWGIAGKTNPHASNGFERANHILEKRRARLAPKPEPTQSAVIDTLRSEDFQRANACIECGAIIVHQELHVKWHAALVERRTK